MINVFRIILLVNSVISCFWLTLAKYHRSTAASTCFTKDRKLFSPHTFWQIGGGGAGYRDAHPSGSNFFHFDAVFKEKNYQITGWCSHIGSWRHPPPPRLGNPATDTSECISTKRLPYMNIETFMHNPNYVH